MNVYDSIIQTFKQTLANKTDPASISRYDVFNDLSALAQLSLLLTQSDITKLYKKDQYTRDSAYNLFVSLQDNVSGDTTNATNWQKISGGAGGSQSVYDVGVVTNVSNAYTSNNATITSYSTAVIYLIQPDVSNTGASTYNNGALTSYPIMKFNGSTLVALSSGDFNASNTYLLIYKGTYFLLTNISSSSSSLFTADILVSLSAGKTLGRWINGQTIPLVGKNIQQGFETLAIESIYPTYNIPTMSLSQSQPYYGEVGESLSNVLTATFSQNDAGGLTAIRIQKNGSDLTPNGVSSPFVKTDTGVRSLTSITYQAYSNYLAGALKNISPSGLPDDRTPLVRDPNAPQAASSNFASNALSYIGYYKIFYSPSATSITTSAQVRAALQNRFTNSGNNFILNTGTAYSIYFIWMPVANSLVSVFDIQSSNANVTGQFALSSLSVNDAGGNPVSGNLYTMTSAVPYAVNHQFNVTIA